MWIEVVSRSAPLRRGGRSCRSGRGGGHRRPRPRRAASPSSIRTARPARWRRERPLTARRPSTRAGRRGAQGRVPAGRRRPPLLARRAAERLLILGGGHVGLALARVAARLSFGVTRRRPAAGVLRLRALPRRRRMPHRRLRRGDTSLPLRDIDLCRHREPGPPRATSSARAPSSRGSTATPASSARGGRAGCSSRSSSPRASTAGQGRGSARADRPRHRRGDSRGNRGRHSRRTDRGAAQSRLARVDRRGPQAKAGDLIAPALCILCIFYAICIFIQYFTISLPLETQAFFRLA